jgi:hypothetical protein
MNSAPVGLKEGVTKTRIGAFEGAKFAGIETGDRQQNNREQLGCAL